MRKMLLRGPILDVVYYTHMVSRTTLFASGDCEFLPYLLLLDAHSSDTAATPRELSYVLDVDMRQLEQAAYLWERDGLLQQVRSPLDKRLRAYVSTLVGSKHAVMLNRLVRAALLDFWRADELMLEDLISAIIPFQKADLLNWPVSDDTSIPLKFFCALFSLWKDYRDFGHQNMLTFSELHQIMVIYENGPIPNRAIYKTRNQFALTDYRTIDSLIQEKQLLEDNRDFARLSSRGIEKVAYMLDRCDPPTRNKINEEKAMPTPAAKLYDVCRQITLHATENDKDD